MSHQAIQSDNNKDETPENCLQSYQYGWMSHWTQMHLKSVDHVHNQLSNCYESGENNHRNKLHTSFSGSEIEPYSSMFMKEFREMNEVLMNESSGRSFKILRPEGSLSLKNGESSSHHEGISKSKLGPKSMCDASLSPTDKSLFSMLKRSPIKPEIQLTESLFQPEGIASVPEQQANSNKFLGEGVDVSSHVKDELLGSTSAGVLSEFNSRRTPVESFSPRRDYINQPSSSFLVHEGKMGKNAVLSIHDPETSNSCHRDFLGQQFQNVTNYGLCAVRPPRLDHKSSELPRNPSFVHGKETMRIYTTIDPRGPSKFSETTHHFFITEDTNVNLSSGVQRFRESISTNFKFKPPSKLLSFSPGFGFNLKQGMKLQPLDSSTESEGKGKIENVHTTVDLKNESSAETDTMDMDTLQENRPLDVAPSFANKDINVPQKSPTSEGALVSVKEKSRGRSLNIVLPDINQELPPIPSAASSTDDGETSTSKTHSMDASDFLFHAEHPTNLKSSVRADGPLELDPCSRWVKRLKPSSSDSFAHGTKSSKMVEASSHEKVNKFFSKMLYCGKSSSEPKMSKSFHKENLMFDQAADFQRNIESVRAGQEKTLSHAWIQRWCHNPLASLHKHNAAAACEPLSSRAMQYNINKRQYPSIAAMALMGKATSAFRPCELRKEGSYMAWNNQVLR
ncbi:uncharacterized protein [Euphorbia lathyris]|uniref:uncharacterized protein n=1 Tax=Euphorbia lathyris TaxID=212925 RepID=UPI003313F879